MKFKTATTIITKTLEPLHASTPYLDTGHEAQGWERTGWDFEPDSKISEFGVQRNAIIKAQKLGHMRQKFPHRP